MKTSKITAVVIASLFALTLSSEAMARGGGMGGGGFADGGGFAGGSMAGSGGGGFQGQMSVGTSHNQVGSQAQSMNQANTQSRNGGQAANTQGQARTQANTQSRNGGQAANTQGQAQTQNRFQTLETNASGNQGQNRNHLANGVGGATE